MTVVSAKFATRNGVYAHGEPIAQYAIPVGCSRFGLQVNKALVAANDVFKKWHVSYRGKMADNIEPIFRGGLLLLKAGDVALGGLAIGICGGHIPRPFQRRNMYAQTDELFDPNQVFTSPSARYSSHPAYAKEYIVTHPDHPSKKLLMRFMFQCRQRPGSYSIGQETVGAASQKVTLDPHFDNNQLEWYTKENAGVLVYGLLVQVREL